MDISGISIGDTVNTTCDGFATEKESQEWFADFAVRTGVFKVYCQVHGSRIIKHHLQDEQERFIADAILIPTDKRITLGAVAVEIKRSGERIGPGISQLKDYMNCVFPVSNNIAVMPTYGFLFPCHKQNKATASWMQHQHLGTIEINRYRSTVAFYSGEERLLEFGVDGTLIHVVEPKSGRKSGSR